MLDTCQHRPNKNKLNLSTKDLIISKNISNIPLPNFEWNIYLLSTHYWLDNQVPVCTKDYHYYSFFPRATREWNKLSDAVHATTVEAFKAKLSAAAATDN